jgi:heme A synthase
LAFAVAFALVIAVAFAIAVALHRVTRKSRHPERVEKIPMRAELNISVAILALIGVLGSITTQAQVGLKEKRPFRLVRRMSF